MRCKKKGKTLVVITALCSVFLVLTMFISGFPESNSKSALTDEQLIAGEWLRPDGGYVLVLSDVKKSGTLRAAYFNPRPIHVEEAGWRRMADRIQVFVELRDVNYPGSTYTLIYDQELDRFVGYYYQAARGQTFDVIFLRRK